MAKIRIPGGFLSRITVKPGTCVAKTNPGRFANDPFVLAMRQCIRTSLVPRCECLAYGEGGDLPPAGSSPFECGER